MDGARALAERYSIDDHEAVASTLKYCEAIKWTKGKDGVSRPEGYRGPEEIRSPGFGKVVSASAAGAGRENPRRESIRIRLSRPAPGSTGERRRRRACHGVSGQKKKAAISRPRAPSAARARRAPC